MLRFPYLEEPLIGSPPPTLDAGTSSRWRPLIPITVIGPAGGSRQFLRALVDSGSDDILFPMDLAKIIGVSFMPSAGHATRWRGQRFVLEYGHVELLLTDGSSTFQWPAVIGFTAAPIRYPLLGMAGYLQFMDVTFRGDQRIIEMEVNKLFPGQVG